MATLPNTGMETIEQSSVTKRETENGNFEILDDLLGALSADALPAFVKTHDGSISATTPYSTTGDYLLRIAVVKPGSSASKTITRIDVDCWLPFAGITDPTTASSVFQVGNREDTGAGGFASISVTVAQHVRTGSNTGSLTFDGSNPYAFVRVTTAGNHETPTFTGWTSA